MRLLMVSAGLVLLTAAVPAQQNASATFEVASIKAVAPFAPGTAPPRASLRITGNRLDIHNYTLLAVLNWTFNPGPGTLVVPDWLRTAPERVDIQAVCPAGCTRADVQVMLRALLTERMGLKLHVEPRMVRAFDLVTAPGGHTMTPAAEANELDVDLQVQKDAQRKLGRGDAEKWITRSRQGAKAIC